MVVVIEYYLLLGLLDDVLIVLVFVVVVFVDKLDVLMGFWVIDEKLMGLKDLFVLCCVVLGVICLFLENGIKINFLGNYDGLILKV